MNHHLALHEALEIWCRWLQEPTSDVCDPDFLATVPMSTLQACEVFFCFLDAEPCFMRSR